MNQLFWWTGLVVWCLFGLFGLGASFVLLMFAMDEWWAERLKNAGRLAYTMVVINTWTRTKEGRELHQAAEEAVQRFRKQIREEEEAGR